MVSCLDMDLIDHDELQLVDEVDKEVCQNEKCTRNGMEIKKIQISLEMKSLLSLKANADVGQKPTMISKSMKRGECGWLEVEQHHTGCQNIINYNLSFSDEVRCRW